MVLDADHGGPHVVAMVAEVAVVPCAALMHRAGLQNVGVPVDLLVVAVVVEMVVEEIVAVVEEMISMTNS